MKWSATDVRALNNLVSKVKMPIPVVMFRLVCLEEVAVVTAFDAFSEERRGCSQGTFLTMMTSRGVDKGASVCTIIEVVSTVLYRVIGKSAGGRIGSCGKCSRAPTLRSGLGGSVAERSRLAIST